MTYDMLDLSPLILHRDASVLVIDKPANIAVHKGFGDGDTLEKYFHQLQFGLPMVPQLAHRLDRATSGCLVLGRHRQALQRLQHLFSSQQIEKKYLAVVVGQPPEEGTIELKLAKQEKAKHRWWMKVDEAGQDARTDYKLLKTNGMLSLVELSPKTGRTHQLRVHMAAIGHPIVGDGKYGGKDAFLTGSISRKMHLHARRIRIDHPSGSPLDVRAELPSHMKHSFADLGFDLSLGDAMPLDEPKYQDSAEARRRLTANIAKAARKERKGERRARGAKAEVPGGRKAVRKKASPLKEKQGAAKRKMPPSRGPSKPRTGK